MFNKLLLIVCLLFGTVIPAQAMSQDKASASTVALESQDSSSPGKTRYLPTSYNFEVQRNNGTYCEVRVYFSGDRGIFGMQMSNLKVKNANGTVYFNGSIYHDDYSLGSGSGNGHVCFVTIPTNVSQVRITTTNLVIGYYSGGWISEYDINYLVSF